jgi:hypothetical protein
MPKPSQPDSNSATVFDNIPGAGHKNKEKGDKTMSMSVYWGLLISLLVILLVTGLYWLVLRVFSVWNFFSRDTWRNLTPEAKQLAYLFAAWVALVAAALWIVAPLTALRTESWGFGLLGMGMMFLIFGIRRKP